MAQIKFGTDGWRAVIAEDFTFANVARVAQASADYWNAECGARNAEKRVVIGYDRRFFSDRFAKTSAEVFAGNDFKVVLTPEPTPTPSVSFAVKHLGAVGGVMITASHNPPIFNGFKLKSDYGGSSSSEECQAIEGFLDRNPVRSKNLAEAIHAKQVVVKDVRPAHYAALKRLVDFKLIAKSKLRFAHEALFGVERVASSNCLRARRARSRLWTANTTCFSEASIPSPSRRITSKAAPTSKSIRTDICLVTDGDADRVGGMDGRGNLLTTHQIICLLLHHLVVNRRGRGRVVKALTTTSMVDKMCAAYGLEMTETGVGFKYICAEMLKGGVLLGAEESGGIGFTNHIPERDGIAAGLMLLEMLATERVSVNKLVVNLEKEFGPHHYGRIDTHFPLEKRAALMEYLQKNPPAKLLRSPLAEVKSYDGVKFIAEDTSWLMLRGSGTEPILRIYSEAKSDADVRKLLALGVSLTKRV